ncbi:5-formyltetrahydrofolate cyclo-ligase [bacterium]|nr:5-formyltetrahydrofolate cyclo-ligase [bacterium]|tara:strand:+ start:678 stop:1250 length:573 start_codon:yes stop_codon:yes gene_type:complete
MITKRIVRNAVKARKSLLTSDSRRKRSLVLNKHLKTLLTNIATENVICFLPLDHEPLIDVSYLLSKYRIFVPKKINNTYSFVSLSSMDSVQKGDFGVLEPNESCLCSVDILNSSDTTFLVPGLAFDYRGNRIGYGQGIYDRLLAQVKGVLIGICFEEQLFASIPTEKHDKTMMYIVHENDFFPCVGDDGY